MSGRRAAEAVQRYLDPLQQAIACVTRKPLNNFGGYYAATSPHLLTIGDGTPVRLLGNSRLSLVMTEHYRVIETNVSPERWRVVVVAYMYALEDRDGREVLAFHWHPELRGEVTFPHLHLGAGAQIGLRRLASAHVPTGLVSLGNVLRLAIDELDVEPLPDKRESWRRTIERARSPWLDATL